MRIQLSRLRVRVVAGGERFGTDLSFTDGLNLVRADNSAGKSTCMNSIMWALGVEGMLGPQHAVPLPHAMKSQIEAPDGTEHTVSESHVILEIQRADGEYLTIRRQVAGDVDTRLVRVWENPVLSRPASGGSPLDYYVRRPGAAQEERGFHRFLADWCGWNIPEVARFDGSAVPLYIEAVAPLWIIEQKRGWAGLQALTPTYLRISDVKKRALEHVLDLDVLSRRARTQELEQKLSDLRTQWTECHAGLAAQVKQAGATIQGLPRQPTGDWPPTPEPHVLVSMADGWQTIREAARETAQVLASLDARSRSSDTTDAQLPEKLKAAEDELQQAMAASAQLRHAIARDRESSEQTERRLAAIEQDRRRHKDLVVLRELGSDDTSLLQTESCPICNRELGDVLLDETSRGRVMGVDETINYLEAQADLTKTVIASTRASLDAREARLEALARRSADIRSKIFALRTDLTGGSTVVSNAEALLASRRELEMYETTEETFSVALDDFNTLSEEWRTTESELRKFRLTELSDDDRRKLDSLQNEFRDQLSSYGFQSLRPNSLTISQDTYQPAHEGYDPAFESSASDVIRIIWAYLLSLRRVSEDLDLNHPGLVIFDEPRQQMASEISFRELLRRAAANSGQVVFATSETGQKLADMLEGLDHHTIDFDGKILQPLAG